MTLTEFLLARIAADEELAQTAIRPEEMHPWGDRSLPQTSPAQWADEVNGYLGGTWGEHCGNWNPLRVLAECAAKRRIIELHEQIVGYPVDVRYTGGVVYETACLICHLNDRIHENYGPCETLVALAAVYAGHPDYQETWNV